MKYKFPVKISGKKSDEDILKDFSSTGDLEILADLYTGYMHLVYGVCLKYLRDREDSRDAVMQIFEKLITEIPKQKIENFRGWLHVVTKNYCLMQLRSKKSDAEKFSELALDPVYFMENIPGMHPLDSDDPDMEEELADCIERLRIEQKQCIRLFYYENKCYSEIAGDLGLDEKKVKSYLQNGKRNLKLCLEEKNEKSNQKERW